jgi:hypothetical protein
MRFWSGLSETTLQASTDVGHEDHQALVALPLLSAEIAGERRFVRLADRPWGSPWADGAGGTVLDVAEEVLDRGAVLTGLDHQ